MAKIKDKGRPPGSPNQGNSYTRTEQVNFRATEGYKQTIKALQLQDPANKLSEADIIHTALQLYAIRKLSKKGDIYWVNRII